MSTSQMMNDDIVTERNNTQYTVLDSVVFYMCYTR